MLYTDKEKQNPDSERLDLPKIKKKELSLTASMIISSILHIIVPAFLLMAIIIGAFLLALIGIKLALLEPSKPKVKDLEFVLIQAPSQKPTTKTTLKADRDSKAGGKHDPKKVIQEPKPQTSASKPQPKTQPQKRQVQQQKQVIIVRKAITHKQAAKTQQKPKITKHVEEQVTKPTITKPQAPVPKLPMPVTKANTTTLPPNPLAPPIKVPTGAKAGMAPSTNSNAGPITRNSGLPSESGNTGPSGPAPITMSSPTSSKSGNSSGSSSRSGASSYGSQGQAGNPSPGNPSGPPGIAARRDVDFGAYMADLQSRIKRNWAPPKQELSKRVILMFNIGRNGQLLGLRVYKSSGDPSTDRAAISAVQLSAPFRPLPAGFSGSSVDIQFTFDYNVFGASRR